MVMQDNLLLFGVLCQLFGKELSWYLAAYSPMVLQKNVSSHEHKQTWGKGALRDKC